METSASRYAMLLGFFSKAKGMTPGIKQELQAKSQELRERLDKLERFG
jgi:hypothetical protein